MRRWDALVDGYLKECEVREISEGTVKIRASELGRFGNWLKRRRPRPALDAVDSDHLIGYISQRTVCRSKATVCGVTSILRNMGEYLVQQGMWKQNPLRWIHGPKLDGRRRVPRRIGREHMDRLWKAVEGVQPDGKRSLCLAVLAVVYGTGLRRGEMERLDLSDWNRGADGTGEPRRLEVHRGLSAGQAQHT
jgi:site-specific recombinase XerD